MIALGNLPSVENPGDDNAELMPIGGNSAIEDVNPVPIQLGTSDVKKAVGEIVTKDTGLVPPNNAPSMSITSKPDTEKDSPSSTNERRAAC